MNNAIFKVPFPENETILNYRPNSNECKALENELRQQSVNKVNIPLVINGQRIFTDSNSEITAPHDKSLVLANSQNAEKEHIQQAIDSALVARQQWASLPWSERAAVFLKAADLITSKYRYKINAATMLGQSKTCYQAEIEAACELADFLRFNAYFAQNIYAEQPLHSPRGQWNRSEVRPLEGFVFAIAPFNFTAISLNLACAPALMGCTVVWKPSPTAVLSSYIGLEILEEAGLPAGVINMITGDAATIGDEVLKSKDLSGIHFTGSTKTFQHLWRQVGQNIDQYKSYPRIVGETGGKDFIFAHNSASPDELVTAMIRGSFEYQGQKCSASSRAYIPASLWPKVKQNLIDQTNEIKMGDPKDFSNFMCAVIDEVAFDKITKYIDDAKTSKDAEIICGGEYDKSKGYFIRPTIIVTKDPHYKTMVEEIFGPVLTVYIYEDENYTQALELCENSTPYALTGAIFAKDRHIINQLSKYFENSAGNFYINDKPTGAVVGQQPFGGARASGTNDKAGSTLNLLRWVSHRSIKENFLSITDYRYPHMGEY